MGVDAYKIVKVNKEISFKQSGCDLWFRLLRETDNDKYIDESLAGMMHFNGIDIIEMAGLLMKLEHEYDAKDVTICDEIIMKIADDIDKSDDGLARYYCY